MLGLTKSTPAFPFIESFCMKRIPLALVMSLTVAFSQSTPAQNLLDLWGAAKSYDASYQSALALYKSSKNKADEGLSGILPTMALSTNSTRNLIDYTPDVITVNQANPSSSVIPYQRWFGTHIATFTAVQPLYRPANYQTYLQSKSMLAQSVAQLVASEQDLIVRMCQAYFDVLVSQETLDFTRAQKRATEEQLAFAKRNFEVGTATITDTHDAQARYDLVVAQEVAAQNDLNVKKMNLDQLVGMQQTKPVPMMSEAPIERLMPSNIEEWVANSEKSHPSVLNSKLGLDIANLEVKKSVAGHLPTVDLTASMTGTRNLDGTNTSGLSTLGTHVLNKSVGVVVNVPIFSGFYVENRIKETENLADKARYDYEYAKRTAALSTQSAFLNLVSGIGQVNALKAAERSTQKSLESNQLGYSVGLKLNIDVLNAQSQRYQTKRDLAQARYNVLMQELKLKQASGILQASDLNELNDMLERQP